MRKGFYSFVISLATLIVSGSAHGQSKPVDASELAKRFGNIDEIDIALDPAQEPRTGRCSGSCFPIFHFHPPGGRGQATVIFAYVIDSTGRAEKSSVSIIQEGPTPDFRASACEFARRAPHTFPDGVAPHRMLVLQAITLTSDQPLVPVNIQPVRSTMRSTPREDLFQQLAAFKHC